MLKKYFALFETEEQYNAFLNSEDFVQPNVSLINELRKLYFNKKASEEPAKFFINGEPYTDKVITLAAGGTYEMEGILEGQIIIDAKTVQPEDYTYVRFNDVTIISDEAYGIMYTTPAEDGFNDKGYKGMVLTLDRDSHNFIICNKENTVEDDRTYASLNSWKELTVQGVGYLALYNNIGHALRGEDVTLGGPHIYMDAAHDGIHGKNVNILDGVFYVKNAKDGVGTTDKGKINIFGGSFEHETLIDGTMFDSAKIGYFVDGYNFGSYEHNNINALSTKYEAGSVIAYNAANPNGVEIFPGNISKSVYVPSPEIPAHGEIYSFESFADAEGVSKYADGKAEVIEKDENGAKIKVIENSIEGFVGNVYNVNTLDTTELIQLFSEEGLAQQIWVRVTLYSNAQEAVPAGANAVLQVSNTIAYENAYDLTGYTSATITGKIVNPIIFPLWAQTPSYPITFSAKGKLKSYTGNFDLTLSGAYIETANDMPSILYGVDVDRIKITCAKDTINAIINTNTDGINDLDAVKSENNLAVELKSGSILYVTSAMGDGLDSGEVRLTDSKGHIVINKCGQRGIKGNAIVIGPNAIITESIISSYYTDPTDAENYKTFNGIAVVKNNCQVNQPSNGVITAADPEAKQTGFADIYARNGKHKKGVFGTTNAELKGAVICGTLGAAISIDMGDADNLYFNSAFKAGANEVPPTVEAHKVIDLDGNPVI